MKKRVLHIIPGLELGGAETLLYNFLKYSNYDKFEYYVLSLQNDGYYSPLMRSLGVVVLHINMEKENEYGHIFKIINLISSIKPSIIHSHCTFAHYWILPAFWFVSKFTSKRVKVFHTIHSTFNYTKFRFRVFEKILMLIDCHQVAVGKLVKKYHCGHFGVTENKISVIVNGVPPVSYVKSHDFGFKIVTIGNLLPKVKGYEYSLIVINKLLKKYPKIEYHILGEGVLRKEIESFCAENSIDKIKLHGRVVDVYKILSQMDIYFLSSNWEGLPLSVLEAMTCGLPVVGTRVGEIPEMFSENDAFLVEPGDVDAMVKGLETLINSPKKRKQLSMRSLELAKKYNIKTTVSIYEDYYENQKIG